MPRPPTLSFPKRKKGAKYIIKNATVVSVDNEIGTVPNCDVLVEDGFISAVGSSLQHSSGHSVIDGTNAIVSPGFVDTHRHTCEVPCLLFL